jgi:anti-sigma regulatory factor (Ser/Thr protein kinase)
MQPPNSSNAPSPPAPPPAPVPLCLRPDLADLKPLCDFIEAFGESHGFSPSDVMAFTLAAEELFANTIHHSRPPASLVTFALSLAHGVATATYGDDGGAFDPTGAPQADTTLPQEKREIGGLGIHFIRQTMQTFDWRRDDGRNVVTFSRVIGRPALR